MKLILSLLLAFAAFASGTNALDRLDFGDATSEGWHGCKLGIATASTGALGESRRLVPAAGEISFTLACDPVKQSYLTLKLWGNETPCKITFVGVTDGNRYPELEEGGTQAVFPDRFLYYTHPIPISQTQGKTSVHLTLSFSGNRSVYSVFSHLPPCFVPDPADPTGTAPQLTGLATLDALTKSEVVAILRARRQTIYNSGEFLDDTLARQIMPGTAGAPPECIGLDLRTTVSGWNGAAKTPDQWRDQCGSGEHGPGYTTQCEELLSVLSTAYLLPPFTDVNDTAVAGLDRYHQPELLDRIVRLLDGETYKQAIDGNFNREAGNDSNGIPAANAWKGLTSTPRATGHAYQGSTARNGAWTISLEGVDTQSFGFAILHLLDDPAMPAGNGTDGNFLDHLAHSYDADLDGGTMLRAHGYQRMLYRHMLYLRTVTGGVSSQHLFNELGMYACHVALQKLQVLYPNSAYSVTPGNFPDNTYIDSTQSGVDVMKMTTGLAPSTLRGVAYPSSALNGSINYDHTRKGLGEAHGMMSCGFDGGGYGQIIPWLMPRFALLAARDPGVDSTTLEQLREITRDGIDTMNQILSPLERATVNGSGNVTANVFNFAEESFITYRDTKTVNTTANRFNFNAQFPASDGVGGIESPAALRSAYLCTQYGLTPTNGASAGNGAPGGALNYLRDLPAYEATLRRLINVDPATLTPLPHEPGQPDTAWVDVQCGAVAFRNNGERFFMNANWRNFEIAGLPNVSNVARIHHTTPTIERAVQLEMPNNPATVQPDGNLTGSTYISTYVVRYGDYLIVMNNSASTVYQAKLPPGAGQAKDLLSGNFHVLGTTVPVAPGNSAIFWLEASSTLPGGAGAPTVALPAAASQTVVNGTAVNLSVLGADAGGEGNLTYTWAIDGASPGTVAFSGNGTNVAKNTTATFSAPGVYDFVAIITDASGLAISSAIRVTVNPVVTSLGISPATVTLLDGQSTEFSAQPRDQFGRPTMSGQGFTWSVPEGPGGVNPLGAYTASGPGTAVVRVASGTLVANATVNIPTGLGAFGGNQAIGTPSPAGSASFSSGTYTLQSGSGDLWNQADDFRFVYQKLTGNGVITARVVSVTNTHPWVKAGVSFRRSLDDYSANATLFATPTTTNGVAYQWRGSTSASTSQAKISGVVPAVWVRLTRSGNLFTAEYAPDASGVPGTWAQVGSTQSVVMDETAYVGLALAGNGSTATAVIDQVSVVPASHSILPFDDSISSNASGGYVEDIALGKVTLTASSGDLWYEADSFHLAHRGSVGDTTVTARVASLSASPGSSKVGVTIRETLAPGSKHASSLISPSQVVRFGRRTSTNGASSENTFSSYTTPYWLRMVRSGNTFSAWRSPDGAAWTQVGGNQTITMGATVRVGLAAASLDTGGITTAVFDNITITGTANTPPTIATPAAASSATVTVPSVNLSVLGADAAGGEGNLTYSWSLLGMPPGNVGFSANGTNAAKNTTATLSAAGTYFFQMTVTDSGGESVLSEIVRVDANLAAAVPAGLAIAPGPFRATLTWNPSAHATHYQVKRSLVSGGSYTVIAGPAGGAYTDTGLSPGVTYHYVVSAINNQGESANSSEVAITLVASPPQVPTGLTATPDSRRITLAWDSMATATGYQVRRSFTAGGPYAPVADVSSPGFADTGLTNGVTCYYVVISSNSAGISAESAELAATPVPRNQYWDTSTAAGLLNGGGTWDTGSTALWSDTAAGTSNPLVPWLEGNHARFQTGGVLTAALVGTVGVSSFNQSVSNTAVTLTGGTLRIDADAGITNAVGSGNKSLVINSAIQLNSPAVIVQNQTTAGSIYLGGVISESGGSRAIIKTGPGPLGLKTANTFSGGFSITGGEVFSDVNNNLAFFGTGPVTFANTLAAGRNLYIKNTGFTFNNDIIVASGTVNRFEFSHNSTLPLNGTLTGSGFLGLASGFNPVFQFNGDQTAFTGELQFVGNGGTGGATTHHDLTRSTAVGLPLAAVRLDSAAASTNAGNVVSLRWNPPATASAVIPLGSLAGTFGAGQNAANIVVSNAKLATTATWRIGGRNTDTTFAGIIQNGSGTSALTKTGGGALVLSAAQTYTGATVVEAGSLVVNGTLAAGSAVTVQSGGTLAGTGSIGGPAVVESGGIIAPGNGGVGTLAVASLALNGGILKLELNTPAASDRLAVSGAFSASGATTLNITALSNFGPGIYPLVSGAAGIGTGGFVLGTTPPGFLHVLQADGGTLSLVVSNPTAPTGLSATGGVNRITLAWQPVAGATGYQIMRSTTSGSGFTVLGVSSTHGFEDNTVPTGVTWFYRVSVTGGPPSLEASAIAVPPLTAAELAAPPFMLAGGVSHVEVAASVPGRTYQLQRSIMLEPGSWGNVGTPAAGTGGAIILQDPAPLTPRCFYRIGISP